MRARGSPLLRGRAAIAICNHGALLVRVGDGAAIAISHEGALLVRVGDGTAVIRSKSCARALETALLMRCAVKARTSCALKIALL